MTEMAKTVPHCNNQSLQHIISDSLWDEQGLIYDIQDSLAELIGDKENGSLQLDESGFQKQGNSSEGVQRQYCGRLGKKEVTEPYNSSAYIEPQTITKPTYKREFVQIIKQKITFYGGYSCQDN